MFTPIRIAAIFGLSGVSLGAFGAHWLAPVLAANQTVEVWRTASLYHLLHAVALLCLAGKPKAHRRAFRWITLGIVVFSGSLYLLALSNLKPLGAITPLGGLMLLLGWSSLFLNAPQSPEAGDPE